MSHEIRTPLNGVLGIAAALRRRLTDPEAQHLLGVIEDAGDALLSVINDILDLSKIEAGKLELEDDLIDLSVIVEKVGAMHALRAEEKGIDFSIALALRACRYRRGDESRLVQILHNLIGNAIKFTERGEVSVRLSGGDIAPLTLRVSDTGIGMSADQLAHLFQPFVQADASTSKRFGGTGLGMSIVRELAEAMGGTAEARSALGEGTVITVVLPLPAASPSETPIPDVSIAGPGVLAGRKVLVAEDNRTNQLVLRLMLEDLGAEVAIVEDGAAAVSACETNRFDLLLLDIVMPGLSGVEALQAIRAEEERRALPPVPAIAVTGNVMVEDVQGYLVAGFSGHLAKPLAQGRIVEAVAPLL